MFAARVGGYTRIVVIDRVASRLSLARELGATDIMDVVSENLDARLAALALFTWRVSGE
jgi:aryl-alcohol dehydrogenase